MFLTNCRRDTGNTLSNMLDKILFWVVLVWMIGMLVMAIIAVKEVWQEASKPQSDADDIDSPPKKDPSATGQKNDQTTG